MRNRPKQFFIQRMRQEEPSDDIRKKLIRRFKNSGFKVWEPEVAPYMGKTNIQQIYYTDPYTKENLVWVYVGDYWWCRRKKFKIEDVDIVKNKYKKIKQINYEFARLMAIENRSTPEIVVVGLWDARKHDFKQEQVIVYKVKDRTKGYVVG